MKRLFHFFLIGFGLFVAQLIWQKYSAAPAVFVQEDLVISQNQIAQMKQDVFLQTGSRPSAEQLEHLVQIAVDDEVLYREALALKLDQRSPSVQRRLIDLVKVMDVLKNASDDALYKQALKLGLDRSDPVVRRLLIGTMRLIAKKIPSRKAPAQVAHADLENYFHTHEASFMKPPQMKFTQLYFSRDKRGVKGKAQAQLVLQKLLQGSQAQELREKADVFLGGENFSFMTSAALARLFGPAFPQALEKVTPGEWAGPIVSSYGWHLVLVEELRPAKLATLSEVSNQIKSAILQEREQQRLNETLQKLRSRYQIIIEKESDSRA